MHLTDARVLVYEGKEEKSFPVRSARAQQPENFIYPIFLKELYIFFQNLLPQPAPSQSIYSICNSTFRLVPVTLRSALIAVRSLRSVSLTKQGNKIAPASASNPGGSNPGTEKMYAVINHDSCQSRIS
jgi:hypothetical protein